MRSMAHVLRGRAQTHCTWDLGQKSPLDVSLIQGNRSFTTLEFSELDPF